MDKKYQIFISSTFTDLAPHRQAITKSILDLGHIPAGMELFSATDEEQFDYIKQVIDQCDYYVLVLAGRYGSRNEENISYTELEYRYAVDKKKVVLAFIVEDVGNLESQHVNHEDKTELEAFKKDVRTGRIVHFWSSIDHLNAAVIVALTKAFSRYPQIGWVRGNLVSDDSTLRRLDSQNIKIQELEEELSKLHQSSDQTYAGPLQPINLSGTLKLSFNFDTKRSSSQHSSVLELNWSDIAKQFAVELIDGAKDMEVVQSAIEILVNKASPETDNVWINKEMQIVLMINLQSRGIIIQDQQLIFATESVLKELRDSILDQREFGSIMVA